MIGLLIGGTVVLCIGLLTVVFGIPIKEFSFGNTMILTGAIVACTGLVLIGLYFIGREFRSLTRRLDAGLPVPVPAPVPAALPREAVAAPPPRPQPVTDDRLFARDQAQDQDEFVGDAFRDDHDHAPVPSSPPPAWPDHPVARSRDREPAPPAESFEPPAPPAERPRRNIMFASHRRDANRDAPSREALRTPSDDATHRSSSDDFRHRSPEPETTDPFESAWPQSGRSRSESSVTRNGRSAPHADQETPEPVRERFQPPRRADAPSVTIVKSGVVDSMAYSLYSDGSIEAQMPEGMVRFASIDELRAHLDERN